MNMFDKDDYIMSQSEFDAYNKVSERQRDMLEEELYNLQKDLNRLNLRSENGEDIDNELDEKVYEIQRIKEKLEVE